MKDISALGHLFPCSMFYIILQKYAAFLVDVSIYIYIYISGVHHGPSYPSYNASLRTEAAIISEINQSLIIRKGIHFW
jgi:hypothetical protein